MQRRQVWAVVLLIEVTAPSCSGEDEPRACTLIGCPLTHETLVEVASDEASFQPLTVTACFNGQCEQGNLTAPRRGAVLTPTDDATRVWSLAVVICGDGPCILEVEWTAGSRAPIAAGDRFEVTATNEAGDVVVEVAEIADGYTRAYPNGRACDGDGCAVVTSVTRE